MMKDKKYSESVEMYLKTIYQIIQEKGAARSKEIANRMEVKTSSVTNALRSLMEKQLIHYTPYDVITLTKDGENVAKKILQRFELLRSFFITVLNIKQKEAEECACRIEHVISPPVINRLASFVDFVGRCPNGGQKLLDDFREHLNCKNVEHCSPPVEKD